MLVALSDLMYCEDLDAGAIYTLVVVMMMLD
jgi:hypothetical protein